MWHRLGAYFLVDVYTAYMKTSGSLSKTLWKALLKSWHASVSMPKKRLIPCTVVYVQMVGFLQSM